MRRLAGMIALAALATTAAPALAHHSTAMFDRNKEVVLEGVVKELQWTNPHSWLQIIVTDTSGKATEWSFEIGSPNILGRQGWNRNAVKKGEKVTVTGHPLKDGKNGGILMQVVSANGKTYYYHG